MRQSWPRAKTCLPLVACSAELECVRDFRSGIRLSVSWVMVRWIMLGIVGGVATGSLCLPGSGSAPRPPYRSRSIHWFALNVRRSTLPKSRGGRDTRVFIVPSGSPVW